MKFLISIIIPVYNEESTIEKILDKVLEQKEYEKEIIIIDDCSTDKTKALIKNKYSEKVALICNTQNHGKGFCIRRGIQIAKGEVILIQDADLEYDPTDYKKILTPLINNKADVVYGSRFLGGGGAHRVIYFWNRIANALLTFFANILIDMNLTDMETGYKAFKRDAVKDIDIKENGFGFEPEITIKLAKKKLRFYEVGVSYNGRTYQEGKKIGFKDGIWAFYCLVKYRFFK